MKAFTNKILHNYLLNKGECALYAVKFIELDSVGIGFDVLSEETISFFRNKMVVEIFENNWDP